MHAPESQTDQQVHQDGDGVCAFIWSVYDNEYGDGKHSNLFDVN